MAYAHAQTDPRAKLGSILVVGGLHAAVGVGLIAALGVTVTLAPPDEPFEGVIIEPTLPPPPPEPIETQEPIVQQSQATAPDPIIPLNRPSEVDVILTPPDPIIEVAPLAGRPVEQIILPPAPRPTFTPTRPVPRNGPQGWVSTDDYPRSELNRGNEGVARYSVSVDARGRVENCTITASSGHAGLDRATCRNIERRARFEPALNGQQKPVSGTYSGSVSWQIPD